MRRKEAQFQTKFGLWVREKWRGGSAAFELKKAKDDTILLSAFRPHQIIALRSVKKGFLHYKIPDGGYGYKPFDSFVLNKSKAYGVVLFTSGAVMIDIEILITKNKWSYQEAIIVGKKIW